jgi:uncharacterized protein
MKRMKSMSQMKFTGRSITAGVVEGEAMVSREPMSFSHGLDPKTGDVSDSNHEWLGKNVKGKVLIFPYGKGSTTGGLYILEAAKRDNAPAAVVNVETDPVIAGGFILAKVFYDKEIPVVDRLDKNPTETIRNGDVVRVDGNKGTVEIISRK